MNVIFIQTTLNKQCKCLHVVFVRVSFVFVVTFNMVHWKSDIFKTSLDKVNFCLENLKERMIEIVLQKLEIKVFLSWRNYHLPKTKCQGQDNK